jgi:hypothetical protein
MSLIGEVESGLESGYTASNNHHIEVQNLIVFHELPPSLMAKSEQASNLPYGG